MKVKDIMVKDVRTCRPDTNLAEAARIMWSSDCGALPVVEGDGQVAGMITDRDICIAVGTRDVVPSQLKVFDVKPNPRELYACSPEDDVQNALKIMRQQGVRRLPVVSGGKLRGLLCLDDVVFSANKRGEISYDAVVETLKAVSEHRLARQMAAA